MTTTATDVSRQQLGEINESGMNAEQKKNNKSASILTVITSGRWSDGDEFLCDKMRNRNQCASAFIGVDEKLHFCSEYSFQFRAVLHPASDMRFHNFARDIAASLTLNTEHHTA